VTLQAPELLELDTRRSIYELVSSQPGLHLREIARRLGMHINLVEYHLGHLIRSELVVEVRDAGYSRYFPTGPPGGGAGAGADRLTSQEKRVLALLRQPMPLRIIVYLVAAGRAQHRELCAHLGCAPSTLTYHMQRLVAQQVASQVTAGEGKGYSLVDRRGIARLLMLYRPEPFDQIDAFTELWLDLAQGGAEKGQEAPPAPQPAR
jgi:predicted transcriptional regulator